MLRGGGILLQPDHCDSGTCSVKGWIGVSINDFSAQGKSVTLAGMISSQPFDGLLDSTGGLLIPMADFQASGAVGANGTASQLTTAVPIFGSVADGTGAITIPLSLSSSDMQLDATLVAHFVRRPPRPKISGPNHVECSSPTGTPVALSAAASFDPEGFSDIRSFIWSADDPVARDFGPEVKLALSKGKHTVSLREIDQAGKTGSTEMPLDIVDTSPPKLTTVTVNPPCLWPPNHKMVLYRLGVDILVLTQDACDARSTVSVKDVQSSEDPQVQGAGNTSPDVRFGASAFCVRSERSGGGSGRTYTVTLAAVDSDNNQATSQLEIVVPHDNGKDSRCSATDLGNRVVDDDDPACLASGETPRAASTSRPQSMSCAVGGGTPSPALFLAVLFFLVLAWPRCALKRGRSPTSAGAMAMSILVCLGLGPSCTASSTTESCLMGWWLSNATSCTSFCGLQSAPRECTFSDCQMQTFVGLTSDHKALSGALAISVSTREFSGLGPSSTSVWSLSGDRLRPRADGPDFQAECTPGKLVLDGQALVRAPPDLAARLDQAKTTGNWSAIGY
jgi:hypothetical protein